MMDQVSSQSVQHPILSKISEDEADYLMHNEHGWCYCAKCEKFRDKEYDDGEED